MTETLRLGDRLDVDPNLLLGRGVIAGMPSSGKSSTAAVLLEEASRLGVNSLVIAPTDDWWGIKSSADGTGPGLDHVQFGGDDGDVPLDASMGRGIARLVADGMPALLVTSAMGVDARAEFVADVCEELLAVNRRPLLVIVDEEHLLAPRTGGKSDERIRCREALVNLSATGRKPAKIGHYAITQRLARLHTDVRELADVSIVHKLRGANDITAARGLVEDFLDDPADFAQIKTLDRGQAFVIAPEFDVAGVFRIRPKETFDSSASGEWDDGAEHRPEPQGRSKVDLSAIEQQLSEALEEAREHDPEALRQRVAELEQQLADGGGAGAAELAAAEARIAELEERLSTWTALTADARAHAFAAIDAALLEFDSAIAALEAGRPSPDARKRVGQLNDTGRVPANASLEGFRQDDGAARSAPPSMEGVQSTAAPEQRTAQAPADVRDERAAVDDGRRLSPGGESDPSARNGSGHAPLKAGAKRMLAALVDAPRPLTRSELATLAVVSKGGTFSSYLSSLRLAGLIDDSGDIVAPAAGEEILRALGLDPVPRPRTPADVIAPHLPSLKMGARRMLDLLVAAHPEGYTRSQLSELAEIAKGGTFSSYLSSLRTRGLVEERGKRIYAGSVLYLWEESR